MEQISKQTLAKRKKNLIMLQVKNISSYSNLTKGTALLACKIN